MRPLLRAIVYWPCYALVLLCAVVMWLPSFVLAYLEPDNVAWWWWYRADPHD